MRLSTETDCKQKMSTVNQRAPPKGDLDHMSASCRVRISAWCHSRGSEMKGRAAVLVLTQGWRNHMDSSTDIDFPIAYFQKTREGCGCPKCPAGKIFRQISTLLENDSPIFRQREMLSLPRFGHFPARKTAAGKLAAPAGTLLDFLLRDRHSLLEFF